MYMQDISRALRPGGKHLFSFFEMEQQSHYSRIFKTRAQAFAKGEELSHLDTILHRDWIRAWAHDLDFSEPHFTNGYDVEHHRPSWQTIACMQKKTLV